MNKKFAILRGINVGGKRIILMADLKALFEELRFTDVQTYIQSGNVIFNSKEESTDIELSDKIEASILKRYGFDVPVIIRTVNKLKEIVLANPFFQKKEIDTNGLCLTFLKNLPTAERIINIETYDYNPDRFKIIGKEIFILFTGKYHQSKLTNIFFESKLKVPATTRNWKTVLKLLEL